MLFENFKRLPLVRPIYHFLLAFVGALIYGFPSRKLFVVGVTGTKGKTTVLEIMNAILEAAGKKTALLSSLKVKIGANIEKNITENTMPGRFFIQRFLSRAVRAGCEYALVEVTSEGVALSRHRFFDWNEAFLINLHPEHIEAHGSFKKYRAAKLRFLRYAIDEEAKVFINKDDKGTEFYITALNGRGPKTYSKFELTSFFIGASSFFDSDFNKDNAAAAITLAKDLGIEDETIKRTLHDFAGVPGRMEFAQKDPFAVVVDYAHTPDSLEAVYKNLKTQNLTPKTSNPLLICVLGSAGGGRDKWKRPEMGRIAASYCDAIVLTNEDPYNEDPEAIMRQIEDGARENPRFDARLSGMMWKIKDRREAIRHAISLARKGDVVVITGKGSERWIHVKNGKKIPWSDSEVVREVLKKN